MSVVLLWIAASFVAVMFFAVGAGIGRRRGWEDGLDAGYRRGFREGLAAAAGHEPVSPELRIEHVLPDAAEERKLEP